MQNSKSPQFGVSPAYFVSLHGEGFGPDELRSSLPSVLDLGYCGYQPEVFEQAALDKWSPAKARELSRITTDLDFRADIFVAHFLGHAFTTDSSILTASRGLDHLRRVVELTRELGLATTVAVPVLPLQNSRLPFSSLWPAFVEKIHLFWQTAAAELRFAVEPVPGGLVSSSAWFDRLCSDLEHLSGGDAEVFYLLDTGSTWASGEPVPRVAERLAGRVAGTHLSDATDHGHRSAEPGTGSLEWQPLMRVLEQSGYDGGFDIEIACEAADAPAAYRRAREYLGRVTELALQNGGNKA